ncbi:MAG: MFS transporter, partial [Bilophila sp.]
MFLFVILCVAYLFIPFHRVCTAVMAVDLMRDMHMDAALLGTLSSVFFFTYGLMQLPAGLHADSLGARRILPLFLGITALGSLLFGLA